MALALSRTTTFSSLAIPSHKHPLLRQSPPIPTPLISLTTKSSLVLPISSALGRFLPLRCVAGVSSTPDPQDSSSPSAPISSVFVKGLPHSVSEGRLRKVFSEVGEVTDVKIIITKRTRQSLGYGYVWFTREEDARLAAEEMNGKVYSG